MDIKSCGKVEEEWKMPGTTSLCSFDEYLESINRAKLTLNSTSLNLVKARQLQNTRILSELESIKKRLSIKNLIQVLIDNEGESSKRRVARAIRKAVLEETVLKIEIMWNKETQ